MRSLICEIIFRFAVDYADTSVVPFEPPSLAVQSVSSNTQAWPDWVAAQPVPVLDNNRALETDSFKFSSKATGLVVKVFQVDVWYLLHPVIANILL